MLEWIYIVSGAVFYCYRNLQNLEARLSYTRVMGGILHFHQKQYDTSNQADLF